MIWTRNIFRNSSPHTGQTQKGFGVLYNQKDAPMSDLANGRVVIITGASSGIGAAVARRQARDGMRLTLAARRLDRLDQVATEVEALGGEALVVQGDVCNREDIRRIVQSTVDRWGRIDVLLNNAGINQDKPLIRFRSERIRAEVHINLIAVIEYAQAVLPIMLRQKSGHIINVASMAGLIATPGGTVYSASKFGVNGFSDALRRELHGSGVQVSAFCPGYTPSEISPELKSISEGRPGARHIPGLMTVTYVADQVERLIRHPCLRVIIPPSWKFLAVIAFLFPSMTDSLIPLYFTKKIKGKV
jgi:short-subunit dehydrogenase